MQKWVGLAKATHPLPTFSVTTISVVLAITIGRTWQDCLLIGVTVFTGQLSVGWSNDAIDAKRDAHVNRYTKPIVAGLITRSQVWRAALVAAALCVPLSFANGWLAGLIHISAVASAWAYNFHLKNTVWSWLPYAYSFAALPAFILLSVPIPTGRNTEIEWWAIVTGALLGISAHFANVLPDLSDDAVNQIRGLPQRMGLKRSKLASICFFGLAIAVIVFALINPPS